MGRITETIRCMVRLTDSAILEVAIRWSSAFSRLTDALKAEIKRQTIEQPKRASGRSFASVVTRKRPSLNRAYKAHDGAPASQSRMRIKIKIRIRIKNCAPGIKLAERSVGVSRRLVSGAPLTASGAVREMEGAIEN